jgi:hypothetical protein
VWRSFLNEGNYRWDSALVDQSHYVNISRAVQAVPSSGRKQRVGNSPSYSDVFPMLALDLSAYTSNAEMLSEAIKFWGADSSVEGAPFDKILLSPSWGGAWFTKFHPFEGEKGQIRTIKKCTENELSTLFQNEMYTPTDLSLRLHQDRVSKVLPKSKIQNVSRMTDYGAMHLRTHFWYGKKATLTDISNAVRNCMDRFPKIRVWWIVTDHPDSLFNMTMVATAGNITNLPLPPYVLEPQYQAKIVHGYHDKEFLLMNEHTGRANKALYNHARMAPGIMDWMVLHESKSLAVVGDGSYASSGARGNGKILSGYCGTAGKHQPVSKHVYLNVYTPRTRPAYPIS